ncbi:hypothetical protein GCM10009753_77950 [Streptantibioticus ferralitis]
MARQDFSRGIPCWSRKFWKAVGGLGGIASPVGGRPLMCSMFTAMAVKDVLQVGLRLSSVAAAAHTVSMGELVDGALDSGADRIPGLPVGRLLLGADADLRVAEFSRGKPTFRALSREVVQRVRAGQGWHWLWVNRATISGAAVGEEVG